MSIDIEVLKKSINDLSKSVDKLSKDSNKELLKSLDSNKKSINILNDNIKDFNYNIKHGINTIDNYTGELVEFNKAVLSGSRNVEILGTSLKNYNKTLDDLNKSTRFSEQSTARLFDQFQANIIGSKNISSISDFIKQINKMGYDSEEASDMISSITRAQNTLGSSIEKLRRGGQLSLSELLLLDPKDADNITKFQESFSNNLESANSPMVKFQNTMETLKSNVADFSLSVQKALLPVFEKIASVINFVSPAILGLSNSVGRILKNDFTSASVVVGLLFFSLKKGVNFAKKLTSAFKGISIETLKAASAHNTLTKATQKDILVEKEKTIVANKQAAAYYNLARSAHAAANAELVLSRTPTKSSMPSSFRGIPITTAEGKTTPPTKRGGPPTKRGGFWGKIPGMGKLTSGIGKIPGMGKLTSGIGALGSKIGGIGKLTSGIGGLAAALTTDLAFNAIGNSLRDNSKDEANQSGAYKTTKVAQGALGGAMQGAGLGAMTGIPPLAVAGGVIGGVIGGLSELSKQLKGTKIGKGIAKLWGKISSAFSKATSFLGDVFKATFSYIGDKIKVGSKVLWKGIKWIGDKMWNNPLAKWLRSEAAKVFGVLSKGLKKAWGLLSDAAKKAWDSGLIKNLPIIGGIIEKYTENVKKREEGKKKLDELKYGDEDSVGIRTKIENLNAEKEKKMSDAKTLSEEQAIREEYIKKTIEEYKKLKEAAEQAESEEDIEKYNNLIAQQNSLLEENADLTTVARKRIEDLKIEQEKKDKIFGEAAAAAANMAEMYSNVYYDGKKASEYAVKQLEALQKTTSEAERIVSTQRKAVAGNENEIEELKKKIEESKKAGNYKEAEELGIKLEEKKNQLIQNRAELIKAEGNLLERNSKILEAQINAINKKYEGEIKTSEIALANAEAQERLASASMIGIGYSAIAAKNSYEQAMNLAKTESLRAKDLQNLAEEAKLDVKNAKTDKEREEAQLRLNKLSNEAAKAQTDSTNAQITAMEKLNKLREGYLDALNEFSFGVGEISLIPTQDAGLATMSAGATRFGGQGQGKVEAASSLSATGAVRNFSNVSGGGQTIAGFQQQDRMIFGNGKSTKERMDHALAKSENLSNIYANNTAASTQTKTYQTVNNVINVSPNGVSVKSDNSNPYSTTQAHPT